MERSRSERKTQFSDVTCGKGSDETWHFITHPARVETLLLTESRWRGLQSGETEKVAVCKPGRGALTRNQRASTLTLAYPTSGPVRNKCLLSEPPRLWDLSQRPRRLKHHGQHKGCGHVAVESSSHTLASPAALLVAKSRDAPELVTVFTEGRGETMGTEAGAWLRAGRQGAGQSGSGHGQREPVSWPLARHLRALVAAPHSGWSGGPHTAGSEQQSLTPFWKPQPKVRLTGPDPGCGQGWLPPQAPGEGPPCLFWLLGAAGALGSWLHPRLFLVFTGPLPLCSPP